MVKGVEEWRNFVFLAIHLQFIVNQKLLEAFQVDIEYIASFSNAVVFRVWLGIVGLDILFNRLQIFGRGFGTLFISAISLISTVAEEGRESERANDIVIGKSACQELWTINFC